MARASLCLADSLYLISLNTLIFTRNAYIMLHCLQKASGLLYSLMKQFPRVCKCLSLFSATKRRCLICEEKEQKDFISCDTEGCDFVYCPECWFDVKVSHNLQLTDTH